MKKSVRILWRVFLAGLGSFVLLVLLTNWGVFGKMPSIKALKDPSASLASEVYAADGTLMGKFYLQDRSNVEIKDISKHAINALIATEDERFRNHSGIDGRALARVLKGVVTFNLDGGGSTITQQLALNLFGDERARNPFTRAMQKLKEWIIAVKLERNFTKDEILEMYLNTVPFGDNVFGIRNAARTFFQKEPDRLDVNEAAVLIGMLKANSTYNPRTHPVESRDRRNTVIDQMVKNDYLKAAEAATIKAQPIPLKFKKLTENTGFAPYFRDVVREEVKKWCKTHKKNNGDNYDIYRDGLKIHTTINPIMQIYAEEAVAKHIAFMQKSYLNVQGNIRSGSVWKNHENVLEAAMKNSDRWANLKEDGMKEEDIKKTFYQKTPMKIFSWNAKREADTVMTPYDSIRYHRQMLQAGFMSMDPETGEIKAWVGGIDFKTYKYDHCNLNTKRQVGSSIKPFLYCQAIRDAGFTPQTSCENTQQNFPGYGLVPAKSKGGGGSVPMAYALAKSLNNVAAYLIKVVKPKNFVEFLKEINIQTKIDPYPSICLGSSEISLYEMMWGYTMFPARGFNTKPIFITRIEDRNGNEIARFATERKEVISEKDAYTMCKMMQGVVDIGTGKRMRGYGISGEMGAKTGTTNDNSDAWFMGYTPQLLSGVWVGCDDRFVRIENSYVGQGGVAALPIWAYFYQKVYANKSLGIDKAAKFVKPDTLANQSGFDYMIENINKVIPPGAQGDDQGGEADDYGGADSLLIDNGNADEYGAESQPLAPTPDPQKATPPTDKKNDGKEGKEPAKNPAVTPPPAPKPVDKKGQKPGTKPFEAKPGAKPENDYGG
jgi:penicillin-binding protein 1A